MGERGRGEGREEGRMEGGWKDKNKNKTYFEETTSGSDSADTLRAQAEVRIRGRVP